MATLEADVKTRLSNTRLVVITNFDSPAATTVNDTRLSAAARDVEAAMQLHSGVKYDSTNGIHVMIAVKGVEIKLLLWGPNVTDKLLQQWEAWEKEASKLRDRDSAIPQTSAVQTPSVENSSEKPRMDLRNFLGYSAEPRQIRYDTDRLEE